MSLARGLLDRTFTTPRGRQEFGRMIAARDLLLMRSNPDHDILFFGGDFIGNEVILSGEFQRAPLRGAFALLRSRGLMAPGGTWLEVGANIGTHTIYASREHDFDRFLLLEPDPISHAVLLRNLRLNGLAGRAEALPFAASARPGQASFARLNWNRGASRISDEGAERVETVRIDDLLGSPGLGGELRLVWMDVEGHELEALKGMAVTLRGVVA